MSETTRREHRQPRTTRPPRRDLARVRPGTLPGSLPTSAPAGVPDKRVQVIAYTRDAVTETEGKTLAEALTAAGPGVRWVNIDVPDATLLREVGAHFKLHP